MDIENAVEELCNGKGYLLFEGYFSQEQVAEARELIYSLSAEEPARASHFHGDENESTQKRVWNLPEKGAIFRTMLSDSKTLAIMEPILGDDLMLSSYAANVLYQGAPGAGTSCRLSLLGLACQGALAANTELELFSGG